MYVAYMNNASLNMHMFTYAHLDLDLYLLAGMKLQY